MKRRSGKTHSRYSLFQSITGNTLSPIPHCDSLSLMLIHVRSKGNKQGSRKIYTGRQRQMLEEIPGNTGKYTRESRAYTKGAKYNEELRRNGTPTRPSVLLGSISSDEQQVSSTWV